MCSWMTCTFLLRVAFMKVVLRRACKSMVLRVLVMKGALKGQFDCEVFTPEGQQLSTLARAVYDFAARSDYWRGVMAGGAG
mmetsp:Transcript_12582/g.35869  ORF Transcript_12582/g.35869 Transcript_12582/m.35869 type:complete len:81 (+) Transcript_12582:127-369(+)